jgi:saccharopine dehydrogenase-like NADP-dependent oxidoreductase
MIAMKIIDDIKAKNGKIVGFSSVCGGLPAPDAANNPIKYKFSWSPLGALRAGQRPAQYLENGEVVTIPGADILGEAISVDLFPKHELEQIPNGYSLPYADYYGIPDAASIFRGTLRFKGFCSVIGQCVKIGLLDEQEIVDTDTAWVELLASKLKQSGVKLDPPTQVFLHWLGVDAPGLATKKTQSIMHSFCDILLSKLSFAPGERDLVLMQVGVKAEYPDGSRELIEALFESEGEPNGETAMAKTVGLTCAIGVTLLLEKRVHAVGVLGPTLREIYAPSLELLEAEDIHFNVTSRPN